MIIHSYRNSEEIIKVKDFCETYPETFDTLIITFQGKVLPGLLKNDLLEEIRDRSFGSSHSKYPIYRVKEARRTLFFLMPVGTPITVGILEEIVYAMHIKHIIMYGSAGVLDQTITEKKIIVPTKAYRDEGTSYHYLPASEWIDLKNHETVSKALEKLQIPHVKGYTWTTDAFYRETRSIYEERKNQGCLCVEMEISAVQAFADLRGVELYSFVYSADSLDHSSWDKRILGKLSVDERVEYFLVAKYIAETLRIHSMQLHDAPFQMILAEKKTIELRLNDEKRSRIVEQDIIEFTNTFDPSKKMQAVVVKIHRFDSFETLYETLPLELCGYKEEEIQFAQASDMEAYYSKELQKQYGVLGIEIKRIK